MLSKILMVLVAALATLNVQAHSGNSCGNVAIKPFVENTPVYMHEAGPHRILTKRWAASDEMKAYFDQQKQLFSVLKDQPVPADHESKLVFGAVGDIMRLPSPQPEFVDDVLKEYFDTIDLLTGNLETLISPNYPVPPDSLYLMNSDPSLLSAFRDKNNRNYFSLISTANNHTYDFGDDAIIDTLKVLRSEGIYQSGMREVAREKPYVVVEKNGIKIGYYAITTFVNDTKALENSKLHLNPMVKGIEPIPFNAWKDSCELDLSDTKRVLKQMELDGADVRVISIHWGMEHEMYPRPVQIDIAHELVKQGADVIVGAHPHVPQPSEVCFVNGYEESLGPELADAQKDNGCVIETGDGRSRKAMIYYSLGNFTSYSPFFWQQVGTIGELSFVKQRQENGDSVVDWFAPNYVFTYDHVDNPPHGKQHINLLSNYMVRQCNSTSCPATTKMMVGALDRHVYRESLSWFEELRIATITGFAALTELIYWQFFAPNPGSE